MSVTPEETTLATPARVQKHFPTTVCTVKTVESVIFPYPLGLFLHVKMRVHITQLG